jgi:Lipase maturation factor
MFVRVPLPTSPLTALEPFRIANQYGLFAVMTRGRYEIEFQGSAEGQNWVAYPFRYKPQELNEPLRIYAPYQPRFDWNLWFASLGTWREYPIVPNTEVRLLSNDKDDWHFLQAILFRGSRRDRFVPCFGNTGSQQGGKNAQQECGGADNSWACTPRRWSASLMERSKRSNGR